MKISTSSTLFAFSALAAINSALISANDNIADSSLLTSTMDPSEDLAAPMLDQQRPRAGHLSLIGLDPRIPLTKDEAAFLEATLRHVFNTNNEKEGIDLVADTVAIAGDFVEDADADADTDAANTNLRGADRKLRPSTDRERCWHDPFGPLKGTIIEDCCYDIEFYVDCYCDLCDDSYYSWVDDLVWAKWDDIFDQPDVLINDDVFFQYTDDDIYTNYIATDAPSASPSTSPSTSPSASPSASPSTSPSASPSTSPSTFPTLAPTDQPDVLINDDVFYQYTDDDVYLKYIATAAPTTAPSASPSTSPTLAPTKNEDDEIDIAMERGPQEPDFDPVAMQILHQLRHSPFRAFRHVRKVRFGGW